MRFVSYRCPSASRQTVANTAEAFARSPALIVFVGMHSDSQLYFSDRGANINLARAS